MAYIDSTYVNNALGSDLVSKLIDSDSTVLDQLIADAQAFVDSVLDSAGYAVPLGGTVPQLVKRATLGALLPSLFGRKGEKVKEELNSHLFIFERIRTGKLRVIELTPKTQDSVGGSKWTSTSDKPPIFKNLRDLY